MEPDLGGFFDAAHARPVTALEVVQLELAARESFHVREIGDGVEADQVVDDQGGAGGGVEGVAVRDAAAAHGVPLLQQGLDVLELRHETLRLPVVAAVEEAAEALVQVAVECLERVQQEAELGGGEIEFENLGVMVQETAEDILEGGRVPGGGGVGGVVYRVVRLMPLFGSLGAPQYLKVWQRRVELGDG